MFKHKKVLDKYGFIQRTASSRIELKCVFLGKEFVVVPLTKKGNIKPDIEERAMNSVFQIPGLR